MLNPVKNLMKDNELEGSVSVISDEITITGTVTSSGNLIINDELGIGNFFSFLAAMMLAYQPVRALSTLNITLNQGLSAASRIIPIIDQKNYIIDLSDAKTLKIKNSDISFKNLKFSYEVNEKTTLNYINLDFTGGKMTSLVGHSGSGKSTLLNCMGLIDKFISGKFKVLHKDYSLLTESEITNIRLNEIGFVFQNHRLFPEFSALENIIIPSLIKKIPYDEAKIISGREKVTELLSSR